MSTLALQVAAAIFSLGALIHLSRLVFRWSLVVEGHEMPIWMNGVGFVVALSLAIWMWSASRKDKALKAPWER